MTPDQLIAELKRKKLQLRSELMKAEKKTIDEAERLALSFSSGPFSSAQLRKMGHPYSRRRPTARFPAVINVQTGQFKKAWRTRNNSGTSVIRFTLINEDRVADFMKGTSKMVPRPIIDLIKKLIKKEREKNIADAIDKVSQ